MEEQLLKPKKGSIGEVLNETSFNTNDGKTMYGKEILMDNGDSYAIWNTDKELIDKFYKGREMTYQIKVIKDGGKEKSRLNSYEFEDEKLTRKESAEPYIAKEVNKMISLAAAYAKDWCIARDKTTPSEFNKAADMMYEWMRETLLNENYELQEEE